MLKLGCEITAYLLQVLGYGLLHLNLASTVAWIHIVKHLLAALACVKLNVAVQELIDMLKCCKLAQLQAQVVESGVLIVGFHHRCCLLECLCTEEEYRSEVEVVAKATHLVVDYRCLGAVGLVAVVVVGIEHTCLSVLGNLHKTVECKHTKFQAVIFSVKKHIVGIGMLGYLLDCLARIQAVDFNHLTALNRVCALLFLEKIDGLN